METNSENEDIHFSEDQNSVVVRLLKEYPVLLEKSQVPTVKDAKQKALVELTQKFNETTGKILPTAKVSKKIHNLKTEVKKKTDVNRTGNARITLKKWETDFLTLMNSESNPTFTQIPGASSVGVSQQISQADQPSGSNNQLVVFHSQPEELAPPPTKKSKGAETILTQAETEETKKLSTTQLHRLVLLEQLRLIKMKQERFSTIHLIQGSILPEYQPE